jgi:tRNA threonylcarbamoyladenosine biosynthesis protein TsaB
MRTLALETTDFHGSVALLEDLCVMRERNLTAQQRSAQWLAPLIQETMLEQSWTMDSLDLIAVTHGPGSFTGLRVGVTFAKTLAFALQKPVLGIDTLAVLVEQGRSCLPHATRFHAMLDAQRQELFFATFQSEDSERPLRKITDTQILSRAQWLERLSPGDVVNGPVLANRAEELPINVFKAEPAAWRPQARTVGSLAVQAYKAGERHDLWQLMPQYYRPSYAEEKRPASVSSSVD